ncbi:hypothetical protein OBBRIDRAFT_885503 [Obba rivulosa]|uniref:Uncharacterized protein n=1 Tax=Obba rivulosa TaxID=1052685 RepID=A0A8E2J2S7_9APHY|nr:hypothetical protein OBBRIDRAFT_885503 [Obba rivulosa]
MILPDDLPKAAPGTQGTPPEDIDSVPPPAYPGYPSYQRGQLRIYPDSSTAVPLRPCSIPLAKAESATGRLLRALVAAAMVWSLACAMIWTVDIRIWWARRDNVAEPGIPWPDAQDGKIIECEHGYGRWSGPSETPTWAFDLPLSADMLYIFSRGSLSRGSLNVIQSPKWLRRDAAGVEVTIQNVQKSSFEVITVCKLERESGHSGIGVFTSSSRPGSQSDQLEISISIVLPVDNPTHITALETRLPGFLHSVHTGSDITFGFLSFTTEHTQISAEYLRAEDVKLQTSNGGIIGHIDVTHSLELITSNSQIRTNITAHHDGASDSYTKVKMRTSNAPIISSMDLIATTADASGGMFDFDARTSNGKLELEIPLIPLDSTLKLSARTSNAHAIVAVSPAYEGSFLLRTSTTSPSLENEERAKDPSGRRRYRRLMFVRNRGVMYGTVAWGERRPGAQMGNIEVTSSNSDVLLDLL